MADKHYKRRQELARMGKEGARNNPYPTLHEINSEDHQSFVNIHLAASDDFRRRGEYFRAVRSLGVAYDELGDYGYHARKGKVDKYENAIKNRAQRIVRQASGPDEEIAKKEASGLIKAIEDEQANRLKKGKNGMLLSFILFAGLIIVGLFFLSSNITGNVIGNLTNPASAIIGAILLIGGLVGIFFWFKGRKK